MNKIVTSVLDASGKPFALSKAPVHPAPGRDAAIAGWMPPRRGADHHNIGRNVATARARDIVETDGYAASGRDKSVAAIVGSKLRLKYTPNVRALGLAEDEAREHIDRTQALFEEWAYDPRHYADATRQSHLGGLFGLAFETYFNEGDAIGVMGWDEDRPFSTTLRIVDPDLLCNPNNARDTRSLRGGVELDENGVAIGYHFREAHDRAHFSDPRRSTWTRVAREDECGCPFVIHYFQRRRDGQTRGVSAFDVILEALKMEDKHARLELQAAVLDTVLAPYIKTNMDMDLAVDIFGQGEEGTEGAMNYLGDRSLYYAGDRVEVDGLRMNRLYPGDEMGVAAARRPTPGYGEFEGAVLRRIASALNISYEQLTSDWSQTNYSSARAALNEVWRGWSQKRVDFVDRFCAPVFACWFEEAVERGLIELPGAYLGLHDAYASWTRVEGIGPGKGFVDPVKEVTASRMKIEMGISTLEREEAELTGGNHRDTMRQLARERDEAPEGFVHPAFAPPMPGVAVAVGAAATPAPKDDDDEDVRK